MDRSTVNIGILREEPSRERRVALTPAGVASLTALGCRVFFEKDAGNASHFQNDKYEEAGGTLVYSNDEVYGRSDVILRISPPTEADCRKLLERQTLVSFLHLAVASPAVVRTLLDKEVCSIAYELIEDVNGDAPILQAMSEIAGQMAMPIAARFLESSNNGRGIVLGGITGVPPATVVVLGAGTVGRAAARMALGAGAEVVVLDNDLSRLRALEERFHLRCGTAVASDYNLKKMLGIADVLVGAVLMKGERTPHVVSAELVRRMKPGSIIVDVSIDQGGCVETSRPTTLADPTFVHDGVIHYCVPNIPANAARTATYALTNALLPYLEAIAAKGIDRVVREHIGLALGVCTYRGVCTNAAIARRFELDASPIRSLEI